MKSKIVNFLFGAVVGLPLSLAVFCLWEHPAQAQTIEFERYVQKPNTEEEAFGVAYEGTKNDTEATKTTMPGCYGEEVQELHIEATAYCCGEITKSGKKVREGYCAMKEEWLGLTAIVYEEVDGLPGEFIGIYEIEDTGKDYRIQSGTCVDIYIQDYTKAIEFGRKNVIVYLVDAKG